MEKVCTEIWSQSGFRRQWLLGGLIASVPVVNLLILGYLHRYAASVVAGNGPGLPGWRLDRKLFESSLAGLAVALVYLLVPIGAGLLLSFILCWLFDWIGLSLLGATVAWFPATVAVVLALPLFLLALAHVCARDDLKSAWEWAEVFTLLRRHGQTLWGPVLLFFGLQLLTWPLLGFGFFLGIVPLAAYVSAVYIKTNAYS